MRRSGVRFPSLAPKTRHPLRGVLFFIKGNRTPRGHFADIKVACGKFLGKMVRCRVLKASLSVDEQGRLPCKLLPLTSSKNMVTYFKVALFFYKEIERCEGVLYVGNSLDFESGLWYTCDNINKEVVLWNLLKKSRRLTYQTVNL